MSTGASAAGCAPPSAAVAVPGRSAAGCAPAVSGVAVPGRSAAGCAPASGGGTCSCSLGVNLIVLLATARDAS